MGLAVTVAIATWVGATGSSELPVGGGLVASGTAALILFGGLRGRLYDWLSPRPLQFLGTVSYSLYLIHVPIVAVLLGVQTRLSVLSGDVAAFAMFVGAAGLSVAAAWGMYLLVEHPSIRLAGRLRNRSASDAAATERLAGGIEGPAVASEAAA